MKNTVAIILALLLLAGSAVSCSKPDNGSDNESAENKTTNTDANAGISDETKPEPSLPETGYDGKTISIHSDDFLFANYPDLYIGENDGDIVGNAAYQRNLRTQERLDVNLELIEDPNYTAYINSVLAGDNTFDIITRCNSEIVDGIIQGCFYDLNTLQYINLENPWYIPYVNDDMKMLGSLYVASGYYDMATFARTCVTFFSSKIADEMNLGNFYSMYDNNEWTYDKLITLAEAAMADLNGDGQMLQNDDQFGLTAYAPMNGMLVTTTGYRFTTKTDDGAVATGATEFLIDFNNKVFEIISSPYYIDLNFSNGPALFSLDRALFYFGDISNTQKFGAEMDDYGILPTPKFTQEQEFYSSFCRPTMSGITISTSDPDASAAVLEALNYYSRDTVLPIYTEEALSYKYVNNADASRIVSELFMNVCCDFVQSWYNIIKVSPNLHNSVGSQENYASWFASIDESFNTQMADVFNKIHDVQSASK